MCQELRSSKLQFLEKSHKVVIIILIFPMRKLSLSEFNWLSLCVIVSLWLSQKLHLVLAGSTISSFSPLPCCAYIYTECLHCPSCTPQRKKSINSCGVSGCPHLDDILPRALNPWPINIKNEHHQQSDHMVPGSAERQGALQRRQHSRLAYVTHLTPKVMSHPKYQCPFQILKPPLVPLMRRK